MAYGRCVFFTDSVMIAANLAQVEETRSGKENRSVGDLPTEPQSMSGSERRQPGAPAICDAHEI